MKAGVGMFPHSVTQAVESAKEFEDQGFDRLWITDSHQLYANPYLTLGICARETEHINVSTGVTNPVTRHPTVTANAIATVNQIAPGRASLGIGAGDSAVYSIGETPATVSELRQAASDIIDLLNGNEVTYDGVPYQLGLEHDPAPVFVAAEGPKTLRMAGEVADGIIFGGGTNPNIVEKGLEHVQTGAEWDDRSLEDLEVIVMGPACVADSRPAGVKQLIDLIEPVAYHNFTFSVDDAPAELHDELQRLVEKHDMQEHGQSDAQSAREISPDLREYLGHRFAITGEPEACRERIRKLEQLGVDELMLGFPPVNKTSHAERFSQEVLSASI